MSVWHVYSLKMCVEFHLYIPFVLSLWPILYGNCARCFVLFFSFLNSCIHLFRRAIARAPKLFVHVVVCCFGFFSLLYLVILFHALVCGFVTLCDMREPFSLKQYFTSLLVKSSHWAYTKRTIRIWNKGLEKIRDKKNSHATIYDTDDVDHDDDDDGMDDNDENIVETSTEPLLPNELNEVKKLLFVCSVEFVYYFFFMRFRLESLSTLSSFPILFLLLDPVSKTYYECLCHLLYSAALSHFFHFLFVF